MLGMHMFFVVFHWSIYITIIFSFHLGVAKRISSKICPAMKVPPHHYKGLHETSKGQAPYLIPVAAIEQG